MSSFAAILRLIWHEVGFRSRLLLASWFGPISVRKACSQLRKDGFTVIKGYVPAQLLEELRAACMQSVENFGARDSDGVYWIKKQPGALRLRHLNERQPILDLFSRDMFCRSINFLFSGRLGSPSVQFALTHDGSGRYGAIPGAAERTFGDVYHFDKWYHQLKAMVPLRDVGPDNGPLTVLPGSSGIHLDLLDVYQLDLFDRAMKQKRTDRAKSDVQLDDYDVPEEIRSKLREKYGEKKIVAQAGDMVLFDTRTIHFAGQMQRGERHLLWFYF